MCAVSAILRQGNDDFTRIHQYPYSLQADIWKQWLQQLEAAKKQDELMNNKDCEDQDKLPILQKILNRLEEIEKKLNA